MKIDSKDCDLSNKNLKKLLSNLYFDEYSDHLRVPSGLFDTISSSLIDGGLSKESINRIKSDIKDDNQLPFVYKKQLLKIIDNNNINSEIKIKSKQRISLNNFIDAIQSDDSTFFEDNLRYELDGIEH